MLQRWTCLVVCLLASVQAVRAEQKSLLTVAPDGSGDFKTVQAAVDAVPENNTSRVTIQIKPGTYKERITVPATKPFVTLRADDAATTVLTFDLSATDPGPDGKPLGTFGSYSTMIAGHDFIAENITFENSSGNHGQALAMAATGDRLVFRKCRFLGWQDTLYANGGRQYYADCYIAGRVDFIFGNATAVFDGCEIHSRNGGHVTAASTPQDHPFGYVFLNCRLTGDAIPWTAPAATQPDKLTPQADLGRPWRPYGAVAYINCEMGNHIKPEGWNNWGKTENEKTARFSEYESKGPGANREKRFVWSKQLTDDEAASYTLKNILSGTDNWDPNAQQ
jgi:pectinesterase